MSVGDMRIQTFPCVHLSSNAETCSYLDLQDLPIEAYSLFPAVVLIDNFWQMINGDDLEKSVFPILDEFLE